MRIRSRRNVYPPPMDHSKRIKSLLLRENEKESKLELSSANLVINPYIIDPMAPPINIPKNVP